MDATYVDVNEFTVATDRTAEFITGRRIKANCGVNGIKYCTVLSSAFGATTAVITKESELTANLVTVLYGIVEPRESGSLPDHTHEGTEGSGNIIETGQIKASGVAGLSLEDDGGNGIEVVDGGIIHMAMQSGFSAYLSADQNVGSGAATLIQFDQEEDDPQNEFNLGTYTFTADTDGPRQVSCLIKFAENLQDGKYCEILIKKNAAYYTRIISYTSTAGSGGASISIRMPLVATDTIQMHLLHNNGNNREISRDLCRFSIAKVA